MEWLPYLTTISRKPRSLFNSGIYDMMPENMQRYMKSCGSTDRGAILKVLAELTGRTGFDSAPSDSQSGPSLSGKGSGQLEEPVQETVCGCAGTPVDAIPERCPRTETDAGGSDFL